MIELMFAVTMMSSVMMVYFTLQVNDDKLTDEIRTDVELEQLTDKALLLMAKELRQSIIKQNSAASVIFHPLTNDPDGKISASTEIRYHLIKSTEVLGNRLERINTITNQRQTICSFVDRIRFIHNPPSDKNASATITIQLFLSRLDQRGERRKSRGQTIFLVNGLVGEETP